MTSEDKAELLTQLHDFISAAEGQLSQILHRVGWDKETTFKSKGTELVECPYDASHKMPECSLKRHTQTCKLLKEGCNKTDLDVALSTSVDFYGKASNVHTVHIDGETQASIIRESEWIHGTTGATADGTLKPVPHSAEQATIELTRSQRLAMYDYVVNQAKGARKTTSCSNEELMFLKEEDVAKPSGSLSYKEQEAAMRDFKRRRQSYRAKNVHTTGKSHTEILREVISSQCEVLDKIWNKKVKKEPDDGPWTQQRDHVKEEPRTSSRHQKRDHRSRERTRNMSPERAQRRRSRSKSKKRHRRRSHSRYSEDSDEEHHRRDRHKSKKHKHKSRRDRD
ncbi:unnamed protein product [Owenia fusiformis]|uniref:CHHC U11-48K-type domain-containing protein n=1 Tax=Owenia fusiformis TaxID=6347 RepID=A0A8S4MWT1_OWEFU|nr:unnamed protein product [Owenia fusiformis]